MRLAREHFTQTELSQIFGVTGDHIAKVVTKLMNLANERGIFDRITPQPPEQPAECVETDGFVTVS